MFQINRVRPSVHLFSVYHDRSSSKIESHGSRKQGRRSKCVFVQHEHQNSNNRHQEVQLRSKTYSKQGITPGRRNDMPPPMALLRWQKSRRIYVRPRTCPQSAHFWWPAVTELQAASLKLNSTTRTRPDPHGPNGVSPQKSPCGSGRVRVGSVSVSV